MSASAQLGTVREASYRAAAPPPVAAAHRWRAWDAFVSGAHEAGFMQSSWWADFRVAHGYGHFLLMLKAGGAIVGGALVLRFPHTDESCFYLIPEGPILPRDEQMAELVFRAVLNGVRERCADEGQIVSHLRIEPRWERLPSFVSGFAAPPFVDRYTEPRDTLCIDLRPSADAILAQMKPKGRYNVRLARRRGVSVVEDSSQDGLADFVTIYEDTARRQGMDAKPHEYFADLMSLLLPSGRACIYFAEYEGRRVATALVVSHGRRATYFFGGSLQAHRNVMAPYALHFEIMRSAKATGHEWYDFWGVSPADQPHHPWRGLSDFKRKFGGMEVGLVRTLDYVVEREAYDRYLAIERGT